MLYRGPMMIKHIFLVTISVLWLLQCVLLLEVEIVVARALPICNGGGGANVC